MSRSQPWCACSVLHYMTERDEWWASELSRVSMGGTIHTQSSFVIVRVKDCLQHVMVMELLPQCAYVCGEACSQSACPQALYTSGGLVQWDSSIHPAYSTGPIGVKRGGFPICFDKQVAPTKGLKRTPNSTESIPQLIPCMDVFATPIMHPYVAEIRSTIPIDYIMHASYVRSCDLAGSVCVPYMGVIWGLIPVLWLTLDCKRVGKRILLLISSGALETSHALSYLEKLCPTLPNGTKVVVNCSGKGDKDVQTSLKYLKV
ncbi:hypothetical protein VNO77_16003 [Canavalia gladiata]|uniref:Uncharacterized protein n=1 Tax=Canavalia gladiata TaxID=3824 RepID=A0AAN9M3E6_CANGL